ncbi:hypothetical protein EVAR_39281_1 [Eumeta japonica]|uniref:Uncharacterized protein n=1 Tax=Eumeta variegata TaxID=151549 RepID=A0A4C1VZ60_EUMVA|nr:hypothetical protein EVAR_39281_1 [Eumeta japonica]
MSLKNELYPQNNCINVELSRDVTRCVIRCARAARAGRARTARRPRADEVSENVSGLFAFHHYTTSFHQPPPVSLILFLSPLDILCSPCIVKKGRDGLLPQNTPFSIRNPIPTQEAGSALLTDLESGVSMDNVNRSVN